MRWQTGRRSGNIEDRRGMSPMMVGGGLGTVVIALIAMFLGINPGDILQSPDGAQTPAGAPPQDDQAAQFVSAVLADTEDAWNAIFRQQGRTYEEPTLVLFSGIVQSACGTAQAAMGPFYCPRDHKVYIDLSFYEDLRQRFNAPGDFAQAYVIAHEVGHHVQTLLGITQQVEQARGSTSEIESNALSVRTELQADCFAGVWAHNAQQARNVVEPGDIDEALNAASSIGDDRLQRQAQGTVVPESFTHGTSEQRSRWFRRGFEQGTLGACDTFSAGTV